MSGRVGPAAAATPPCWLARRRPCPGATTRSGRWPGTSCAPPWCAKSGRARLAKSTKPGSATRPWPSKSCRSTPTNRPTRPCCSASSGRSFSRVAWKRGRQGTACARPPARPARPMQPSVRTPPPPPPPLAPQRPPLREEVDLQRRLSLHPSVVRFLGACYHVPRAPPAPRGGGPAPPPGSGATLAILMELCRLGNLFRLVALARRVGRLPPDVRSGAAPPATGEEARLRASPGWRLYSSWATRLAIAQQVAAAVAFMHGQANEGAGGVAEGGVVGGGRPTRPGGRPPHPPPVPLTSPAPTHPGPSERGAPRPHVVQRPLHRALGGQGGRLQPQPGPARRGRAASQW